MFTYKCKNCGGQLEFNGAGGLTCPYCGSRVFFTDADFKNNLEFRKRLLTFYKAEAEKKELDYNTDILWTCRGSESFIMEDGQQLKIEYMIKTEYSGFVCYLARESVVYLFHSEDDAAKFSDGLGRMVFPEADNRLHRSFPELKLAIGLKSGGRVHVYRRRPNWYPAGIFAPWASEHLAWVISRMESICCALQYANIQHGGINPDSVWVNPLNHEGALFGDWRYAGPRKGNGDLVSLRQTAIHLAENTRSPKELYAFLNSAPAPDAYSDFEKWDQVIMEGFGGHKFVNMKL